MPTYALDCELDGRQFHGTALQPGRRTVSAVLRAALTDLHGEAVLSRTCGRLDAGVSAASLVISCPLPRAWDPPQLGRALNTRLPSDLVVHRVAPVPDDWDALVEAVEKTYRYEVRWAPAPRALGDPAWWIRGRFAPDRLAPLAEACRGRLDLSAFSCLRGDVSDGADGMRDYRQAIWKEVSEVHGRRFRFTVIGSGFLYKQVRGLVGAMVAVAQGQESEERFLAGIGRGRDPDDLARNRIGRIAPPDGLRLVSSRFAREPDWQSL